MGASCAAGIHFGEVSPIYKPLRQRDFHRTERATFDTSSEAQTVVVAPKASIRRDVIAAWDIDPRVRNPRAELSDRHVRKRAFANPPLLCSRIPGGAVAMASGLVITNDGRWIVESVGPPVDQAVRRPSFRRIRLAEPRVVDEDVAVIYSVISEKKIANYYHWVIEGLARAAMILASGVPSSVRFLVPEPITDLHLNSLAALGVDKSRVLGWSGGPSRFRSVYLPSGPQHRGAAPIAAAVSLLRSHAIPWERGTPDKRLWISRRLARRRRRLKGESDLFRVAANLGFEEVIAESLSPREQIELFANAEAIAGLHGAGLANAVFMAPQTAVVEAAPDILKPRQKPIFWNLAAAGGQRYGYCVGPSDGLDPTRFERVLATVVT